MAKTTNKSATPSPVVIIPGPQSVYIQHSIHENPRNVRKEIPIKEKKI